MTKSSFWDHKSANAWQRRILWALMLMISRLLRQWASVTCLTWNQIKSTSLPRCKSHAVAFFATRNISNNESTVTRTICGLPDVIETSIYQEGVLYNRPSDFSHMSIFTQSPLPALPLYPLFSPHRFYATDQSQTACRGDKENPEWRKGEQETATFSLSPLI